jgi:hypothetical protein
LQEKKEDLEKELNKKQKLVELKQNTWPSYVIGDMESTIKVTEEQIGEIDALLKPEDSKSRQRLEQMRKRKATQVIEEQRIKRRKLSTQGAPRKLDEEDEEFLAKCVEDKATYHGRRHDLVMYTNRRVKSRDLVNIANKRLKDAGKRLIKSSTTVYNRCKPKNTRSVQASQHIGKGLMCFKKPPKAEDNENENTHYQRAHVKNVKMAMFSEKAGDANKYSLIHSIDDKAYLRPGTSEGFSSARNQKILTLSDASKARQLPKYDWPQKLVYQTPGSHRVMTKQSINDDTGNEKLINDTDEHFVFVRPKSIIGSSGTVWASEMVQLRHTNPSTFQVEANKVQTCTGYTESFSSCCAMLHDYAFQFEDMTTETDLEKLLQKDCETCQKFINYEQQRLKILNSRLQNTLYKVTEMESNFSEAERALFSGRVKPVLDALFDMSSREPDRSILKEHCEKVQRACQNLLQVIAEFKLPPVKPRVAYLTDAGPGVGVSNFEVKFRDAEIARMYNSDYRVRVHRSRGDSGQGEAERTNSAIADSVVDGATIEWETIKRYEGMTSEQISQMSVKQFEEYESDRMTKNAWIIANELVQRIDGAPVLGEYIHCKLSNKADDMFFFNKDYLVEFQNSASQEKRKEVPGSGYMEKILKFQQQHYRTGELFMEYIKYGCSINDNGITCEFCVLCEWTGPPAQRIPQPQQDEGNPGHYLCVFDTPLTDAGGEIREVDDCQPRVFITSMYKDGKISLNDKDAIEEVAAKLAINETLVVSCIEHLRNLEANKERRERERMKIKDKKENSKFEDYNWLELVLSGKINKLLVVELNKYLEKYKLNLKCSKKDKIQAITLNVLKQESVERTKHVMKEVSSQLQDGDDPVDRTVSDDELSYESDEDNSSDDDDDLVFKDFDEESEELSQLAHGLVVTTRSGRSAGSWKLAFTE